MQILAQSKFIRISPRKIRSLASEVKKLRIDEALQVLAFTPKRGGKLIKKTLESAIANAKNNFKIKKNDLVIQTIDISSGTVFKRWNAVSKGTAHPYKKRTSHIRVILEQIKPILAKEKKNGSKS